jgi:hypothetical protein
MIEDTQCLYTGRVIGSAALVEGREGDWSLAQIYIGRQKSPHRLEYRDLAMLRGARERIPTHNV